MSYHADHERPDGAPRTNGCAGPTLFWSSHRQKWETAMQRDGAESERLTVEADRILSEASAKLQAEQVEASEQVDAKVHETV